MRNNDLLTELKYFSEDYNEEREMEPRPEPARAVTPPLRAASPRVRHFRITKKESSLLTEILGTELDMNMVYHLETDGQSERTIQTLEDMLRACVIDFGKG
ncbi:reverse transcriptase domain-containing protein [Tanacetum coccineum]